MGTSAVQAAESAINTAIESALASAGVPAELAGPALSAIEGKLATLTEQELAGLGAKINAPVWAAVQKKEGQEFAWLRPLVDPTVEKFVTALVGPKPASA